MPADPNIEKIKSDLDQVAADVAVAYSTYEATIAERTAERDAAIAQRDSLQTQVDSQEPRIAALESLATDFETRLAAKGA